MNPSSSEGGGNGGGGDGRPPGGTSRKNGDKTPRKVQWLDESTTNTRESDRSTHALDEHGLDPTAFETLTDALERHQSLSQLPPRRPNINTNVLQEQPSSPPPAAQRIHYFPPRPATMQANTELTSFQRGDYFNRASAPPLPSRPLGHSHNLSTATTATTTTMDTETAPPSPVLSPIRDVPNAFIDQNETAGLPGTGALDDYAKHQASKVVRAHTSRHLPFFFGSSKKKEARTKSPARTKKDKEREKRRDVEADVDDPMPPRRMPGGVLSALLTLHDADQSTLVSGTTTPALSDRASLDEPERPWVHPPKSPKSKYSKDDSAVTAVRSDVSSISEHTNSDEPLIMPPLKRTTTGGSVSSWIHRPHQPRHQKNPSERAGGGVFANLIASTGNISGAAAPVPSSLAPSLKRPGYHLSRYSLESNLPTKKTTTKEKTLSRPKSMHFEPSQASSPASTSPGTPYSESGSHLQKRTRWSGVIKDLPYASSVLNLATRSGRSTPATAMSTPTTEGGEEWLDEKQTEHERRRKERRKRKKAEIYITRHVAEIIQRQEFLLKFARAMMMFGGPTHRLQSQIQATARVLDMSISCMYLPDVMLISFDDQSTATSSIKFIRQGSTLTLYKLHDAYKLYWKVIHDKISVSEASCELDNLMVSKPMYNMPKLMFFGGMCSSGICTLAFSGSFIDALVVFPLGCLLVMLQLISVRHELYSNIFEITLATLFSFISAGLASTKYFCFTAVASASVVLILPGFIVLCGSLELMSRNIISGSVRLCYAVVYSLFLGFGLAMGAEAYEKITGQSIDTTEDYTCVNSHDPTGPWYQKNVSMWWAFLTVPLYSIFLSLRNHAAWNTKELPVLVAISCIGWVTNHFTATKFVNQNDISAAVGAFAVGVVANVYARFFSGNAFVVMITGILFQLPSGLGNGGLLSFAEKQISGSSTSYLSGFQTALQLISVSIGLSVGLGIALFIVHPIQSRRRGGGVFSL
ncbi:DUF1212-domain-containing protein [Schizophyllum commune Tattone D]|nr:DUF1212-domain-containing protein [Schizophyllum commune Loenen D]KAI5827981.1 DUF1212-domain-containing protein [Schizophyllum commune Tattone D]